MSIENLFYNHTDEYNMNPRVLVDFDFVIDRQIEDDPCEFLYQAGFLEDNQIFEILPQWVREAAEVLAREIYELYGWSVDFEMNDDVGDDLIAVVQKGSTFKFALIEEEWMEALRGRVYEETKR